MAEVTVTQFAEALKVPVERLLAQLDEAGITVKGESDLISDDAKMELLTHLRRSHGRKGARKDATPKKITLKRKSQSELRMSGGQGRARTVNVEVRRRRTYVNRDVLEEQARQQQAEMDEVRAGEDEVHQAELRAIEDEKKAKEAETERLAAEEQAKIKAAEDAQKQAAEQALAEAETARKAAEDARKQEEDKRKTEREVAKPVRRAPPKEPSPYRRKELHVAHGSGRRRKKKTRRRPVSVHMDAKHGFERPTAPVIREVAIPETISVSELAQRMAVKAPEVIKELMQLGAMVTINQVIDQDTAVLVVEELGHTAKLIKEDQIEDQVLEQGRPAGDAVGRPPVVTIMGHVDHGKTSLLDFIRKAHVTDGEAGGITQHIGAYNVTTEKGNITFLDTPGHAAFTAMRARGAQATDIVVLVVAADDGVMPQTIEAIQHAKAGEVPVVVAVNKIDREDSDPERVMTELSQHGIIPDAWGGDNMIVPVSAKTGQGVNDLLEAILLQSEVLELGSPRDGNASGVVLESSLEKGRGAVATLLIQQGTLRAGDYLLAGTEYGRVRAMFDWNGETVEEATPSFPVAVLGLSGTPSAGDDFMVLENERKAREVATYRQGKHRDVKLAKQQAAKLEDVFSQMEEGQAAVVNILIKADVQGSSEALRDSLTALSRDEVKVKVVSSGVGGITESDVNLAAASQAVIMGFNVRADAAARNLVKETGVELHYHSIIYEAIDEVKRAVGGLLTPEIREQIVGLAEVREVFRSPKFGAIAGSMVIDGFVRKSLPIRVLRDNVVIYEGELESLRRFKDDVNEVRMGTECGIGVRNYTDVRPGDQIECFERIEVPVKV